MLLAAGLLLTCACPLGVAQVWDEARGAYDADATPEYGKDTLEALFTKAVKEGMAGQELGDQAVFGQQ